MTKKNQHISETRQSNVELIEEVDTTDATSSLIHPPQKQADANYLQYTDNSGPQIENLYRYAESRRQKRYEVYKSEGVDNYLSLIADEIKIRTRITQQEIFLIGELLTEVRETIKSVNGLNFKEWVEKNCEFGYDTALNFCKVYAVCLGRVRDIENIQVSVLYRISQKNFPEKLRDYLFNSGAIDKMKLKEVNELLEEYKKNGFKSIPQKAAKYTTDTLLVEQIKGARSKLDEAIYRLKYIRKTLVREDKWETFNNQKGARPVGDAVRAKIYIAFNECISILEKSLEDTYDETLQGLVEKMEKIDQVWDIHDDTAKPGDQDSSDNQLPADARVKIT